MQMCAAFLGGCWYLISEPSRFMFPTLRDAGSQLLLVTNAETTLETPSILHYKSVGSGRPASYKHPCVRGRGNTWRTPVMNLTYAVMAWSWVWECSFRRGEEKGAYELCEAAPRGKGPGSRGPLCGGDLGWGQRGSSWPRMQHHPLFNIWLYDLEHPAYLWSKASTVVKVKSEVQCIHKIMPVSKHSACRRPWKRHAQPRFRLKAGTSVGPNLILKPRLVMGINVSHSCLFKKP